MNVVLYLLNDARKATTTAVVVAVLEPAYRMLVSGADLTVRGAATSAVGGLIAGLVTYGTSNRATVGQHDQERA